MEFFGSSNRVGAVGVLPSVGKTHTIIPEIGSVDERIGLSRA
jgi:hypothetical protein